MAAEAANAALAAATTATMTSGQQKLHRQSGEQTGVVADIAIDEKKQPG